MRRHIPLISNQYYHIYSKTIDRITSFKTPSDYNRMVQLLKFFQYRDLNVKFSTFLTWIKTKKLGFHQAMENLSFGADQRVRVVSYCIMPNHIHLLLHQLWDQGISDYMSHVLNGYSRYFNIRYKRRGPLWQDRFKNVLISDQEYLVHLIRYIHLNPVTSGLVKNAVSWQYSSHKEYLMDMKPLNRICEFEGVLDVHPTNFNKFVMDRAEYQRNLRRIKKFISG